MTPDAVGPDGGDESGGGAPDRGISRRQRWMAALARASVARLEGAWRDLDPAPTVMPVRRPEIGTTMVQARAGGSGARFHLGEMTVTRCAVAVPAADGTPRVGQGYVAGRDKRHAELAAIFDALMQDPARHDDLECRVIGPLVQDQEDHRQQARVQAAATRVEFFTLVRGD